MPGPNRIIIAGRDYPMPPEIPVTTYLDPGGFSFYDGSAPDLQSKIATGDAGDPHPVIFRRRLPKGRTGTVELGGRGWETVDPDPLKALREVVTAVVLHHDGCQDSASCYRVLLQRGYSTHFMVDHDGHIWQATDVADQAIHATSLNPMGIGIDLNNLAPNLMVGAEVNVAGRAPSKEMVINGTPFRSLTYTDKQYESLIALLRVFVDVLGLQPVFPVDEAGKIQDSVLSSPPPDQFRGILCHWHIQEEKWDPGPGLDWERILAGLRREDAGIPVVPLGLADAVRESEDRGRFPPEHLRDEDSARKVLGQVFQNEDGASRLLAHLARAGEKGSGGGWFPMGVNQTWHGGVHFAARRGAPVYPLLKGELVAAHLVPADRFPDLGSNNFVLLRHRISLPPRLAPTAGGAPCPSAVPEGEQGEQETEKLPENILTVYSLYMHLDGVDLARAPEEGLFRALKAHSGGAGPEPPDPPGPILSSLDLKQEPDQIKALKKGYVALFSPVGDEKAVITVGPRDVLGHAGEYGEMRGDKRVVHVEVFADSSCLEAMEMSLYGRYLELGPEDPESKDLVVRASSLLAAFGDPERAREERVRSGKVLSPERIEDFFVGASDPEREGLRRMVVRHVSEWSDQVEWARTLLASQKWRERLGEKESAWVFRQEVERYLPYIWLTADVTSHLGMRAEDGILYHFHPIHFLLWWSFRRSAVRAKSLEEILKCLKGRPLSATEGVKEMLGDFLDLPGQGEWKL